MRTLPSRLLPRNTLHVGRSQSSNEVSQVNADTASSRACTQPPSYSVPGSGLIHSRYSSV